MGVRRVVECGNLQCSEGSCEGGVAGRVERGCRGRGSERKKSCRSRESQGCPLPLESVGSRVHVPVVDVVLGLEGWWGCHLVYQDREFRDHEEG